MQTAARSNKTIKAASVKQHGVVVNMLVAINKVTLRRARLVLGWVTVCGQVNHLGM